MTIVDGVTESIPSGELSEAIIRIFMRIFEDLKMKYGKISDKTLKFGDPVHFPNDIRLAETTGRRHETERRDSGSPRKTLIPMMSSLTGRQSLEISDIRNRSGPKAVIFPGCIKSGNKPIRPVDILKQPIPKLSNKLILSGKVPRISAIKLVFEPRLFGSEAIALDRESTSRARASKESSIPVSMEHQKELRVEAPGKIMPEIPAYVEVKVIPTPKKRESRYVVTSEESSEPLVPKPIKVMRKRRKEAPKVFETAPKLIPQAMLEGIETASEDSNDTSE